MLAVDLVAAAEEVAYAELAAEAVGVGVRGQGAVVDQFGAAHVDQGGGCLGYGAAVVVATEGGEDGAAVDVEGHGCGVVVDGRADAYEGVLGSAEERVDVYVVVVLVGRMSEGVGVACHFGHADADVCRLDVGYGAAQLGAHKTVAGFGGGEVVAGVGVVVEGAGFHDDLAVVVPVVDATVEGILAVVEVGGLGVVGAPVLGGGIVDAAVAVEAAAAAIEVVDVDGVLFVGVAGTDLDVGAFFALHPAGYVVAAVDGKDGVGVVHGDRGVAAHVGHLAAADDVALDDGSLGRLDVDVEVGRADGDGGSEGLGGAVVVVDDGGDGGLGVVEGQVVAGDERAVGVGVAVGSDLGTFAGYAEVAHGAVIEREKHAVDAHVVLDFGGRNGVAAATVVVPVADGGYAAVAEAGGGALVTFEVDAAAVGVFVVFGVGFGNHGVDLATAVGHYVGECRHRAAEADFVAVLGERYQALACHDVGYRHLVLGLGDLHEGGGHTGGVVDQAVDADVVVVGDAVVAGRAFAVPGVATRTVGTVVGELHLLGTLVAAYAVEAPLGVAAVQRDVLAGGVVEVVVHHPEVALLLTAGHFRHFDDSGAVVPVVPGGVDGQRGAGSHFVDAQPLVVRGDEVVAVAVPLLVVVAGIAGAVPHAVGREAVFGGDTGDTGVGRVADVEGQVGVALLHYLGHRAAVVGSQLVDLVPTVGFVEGRQVLCVVGVVLRTVEPVVVAVGEGEVALSPQHLGAATNNQCQKHHSTRVGGCYSIIFRVSQHGLHKLFIGPTPSNLLLHSAMQSDGWSCPVGKYTNFFSFYNFCFSSSLFRPLPSVSAAFWLRLLSGWSRT